jgi:hypothetical protein
VYELERDMPFPEYVKWGKYFNQKSEDIERDQKIGGKNLLESPDALLKGLT